ncbi:MAG: topoisomerase DNA-binding C4 zinc finger domain-containing protein [Verrucomicrobiaceae bacterium]
MARRNESISAILVHESPWWASVIVAGIVYSLMRWVAPLCFTENMIVGPIFKGLPGMAWMGGYFFLGLAGLAALRQGLEALGRRKQAPRHAPKPSPAPTMVAAPICPACHGPMVERTAKRGPNAGNRFWGCQAYPRCHGTLPGR